MTAAALPANEHSRQALLEALGILDTAPEEDYADLVRVAAVVCGVPTALVSLVDGERQWFKARIGMEAEQTPRDVAFCAHAILEPDAVLHVPDTADDARFADNPLVVDDGLRFYAGAPIVVDDLPVGTVCVLDRDARELSPSQLDALQALARQAGRLMELRRVARMLDIQRRERDWYERQLLAQNALVQAHVPAGQVDARQQLDELTGLPGQAAFEQMLDDEIWLRDGTGNPLQVALVEIEGQHGFADLHGADALHEAMRAVARLLRSSGVVEGRVARFGGGFGVLLPMPLEQAVAQLRRLQELVHDAAAGIPFELAVGIGTIEAGERGSDAIECATHALVQARGRAAVETR
jgi:diguanylate cyclase (GGDEF)-like protein